MIAEYSETPALPTTPKWSKTYVYLGGRLLSTLTPNGSGGEATQYHHQDRLGTRLVSDPVAGTSFEQVTLPFGTALDAESTDATNLRFTSYDRSTTTKLDYAVNRHYDSQQGRFTQTDPIGMSAAKLADPQSLNAFIYTQSDPVNWVDPAGTMGDFPSAMYGFDHFVNGFWGWGNLNGWGRDLHSGLSDIMEDEERLHPLGVFVGDFLYPYHFNSIFDDWWPWEGFDASHTDRSISAAVANVRTILSAKNSCSDYLGTNAIKALDALESILTRGYPNGPGDTKLGIKQSGRQTTHEQPTQFRTFEKAVINNAGPFFNLLSTTRFGGYNPGSHQSQALQILHELAHLVFRDGAPLIPDDGGEGNEGKSEGNTKEVLKHCRGEIDKVKN